MSENYLYIHIGIPKTGSTVTQKFIARIHRAGLLGRHNFIYMLPSEYKPLKEVYTLSSFNDTTSEHHNKAKDLRLTIEKKLIESNVLISCEGFAGNIFKNTFSAKDYSEFLGNIFSNLPVKIIIYLRKQDTFLESFYNQKIKEGETYLFSEFLDNIDFNHLDYLENIIKPYENFFGRDNIIVRQYESKISVIEDFIKNVLKINDVKISERISYAQKDIKSNRSLDSYELKIIREVNKILPKEDIKRIRNIIQSYKHSADISTSTINYLSIKKRKELLEKFNKSNDVIVRNYFKDEDAGDFWNIKENKHEKQYDIDKPSEIRELIFFYTKLFLLHEEKIDSASAWRLNSVNTMIRFFKTLKSKFL